MAPEKRVTLKDIARECGVSVMTVSRVMRKQRHVKAEIREQVEAAAERMGYRPDPALSALVRHRSQARMESGLEHGERLALILPEEPQFGWGRFAIMQELEADIVAEAKSLGYWIERITLPSSGVALEATLRRYYSKGIRGLILAPAMDFVHVPEALWNEFVVVTLEPGAHAVPFHAIRNDYFQMMECALNALYTKSHRRIGYLSGPMDIHTHHRPIGALAACSERYIDLEVDIFRVSEFGEEPAEGYFDWIREFRPTALVSMSTWMYKWLEQWEAGERPEIEFAQLNRPRWDTSIDGVCTPPGVHGSMVIQRLHQLLLENERGIPASRTVLRIDAYWQNAE